jgi:hypothetical protein
MKLCNSILHSHPYLLGTWVLRCTNDVHLRDEYTYMVLNDDNTIKLKTIYQKNFFGLKKSRSGLIQEIINNNNEINVKIKYNYHNNYVQSLFGIEIPEIISAKNYYVIKSTLLITLYEKTLLIKVADTTLYYLFDLQIGKIKSPFIESGINTLFFSQFLTFFLNILLANAIHSLIKDLYI